MFVIFKHMLKYLCLYTLLFMEVDKLYTTCVYNYRKPTHSSDLVQQPRGEK